MGGTLNTHRLRSLQVSVLSDIASFVKGYLTVLAGYHMECHFLVMSLLMLSSAKLKLSV